MNPNDEELLQATRELEARFAEALPKVLEEQMEQTLNTLGKHTWWTWYVDTLSKSKEHGMSFTVKDYGQFSILPSTALDSNGVEYGKLMIVGQSEKDAQGYTKIFPPTPIDDFLLNISRLRLVIERPLRLFAVEGQLPGSPAKILSYWLSMDDAMIEAETIKLANPSYSTNTYSIDLGESAVAAVTAELNEQKTEAKRLDDFFDTEL